MKWKIIESDKDQITRESDNGKFRIQTTTQDGSKIRKNYFTRPLYDILMKLEENNYEWGIIDDGLFDTLRDAKKAAKELNEELNK